MNEEERRIRFVDTYVAEACSRLHSLFSDPSDSLVEKFTSISRAQALRMFNTMIEAENKESEEDRKP